MLIKSSCSSNGGGVQNIIDTIAPTQTTNLTATNISKTSSGRFIYKEQEKSKLRNDVSGWPKMSIALKKAF